MSSPTSKNFNFGDVVGQRLKFLVNDILPMHTHDRGSIHITIVAAGSFLVTGDFDPMTRVAGDVIDWEENRPHQFEALTDGVLIQIKKYFGV